MAEGVWEAVRSPATLCRFPYGVGCLQGGVLERSPWGHQGMGCLQGGVLESPGTPRHSSSFSVLGTAL